MVGILFDLIAFTVCAVVIQSNMRGAARYIMAAMDALPNRTAFELNLQNAGFSLAWAFIFSAIMPVLLLS